MAALFIYTIILSLLSIANSEEGVICEENFCRDYLYDTGCTAPNAACSNNSGIWLPSPTICNCCEFCLAVLREGSTCTVGGVGNGITVARCGDGLSCTQRGTSAICTRMDTECHQKQDDYDERFSEGTLGFLEERPRCDDKGKYSPTSCTKTQTCFCQSEDGERIFGEALYRDPIAFESMQCGCSRRHHQMSKNIGSYMEYPLVGPRCTQDGNFNHIQCILNICYCVNKITGVIDTSNLVDLSTKPITELPCYDSTDDLTLIQEEAPYLYTTQCLLHRDWLIAKIIESKELDYNIEYFTSMFDCLPDGSYTRIAVDINGTKTCVDSHREQIGTYSVEPESSQYDNMNCKCAQTTSLMEGLIEKPVCCRNGNFRPIQCRRGWCYCVDENGRQINRESKKVIDLPCFTENWLEC